MFGVRFFSPLCSAITSLLLLRFISREANSRIAFFVVFAGMLTPLLAVGSILMTVDPLAVMCWTAAMVCGWKAVPGGHDDPGAPQGGGPVPDQPAERPAA